MTSRGQYGLRVARLAGCAAIFIAASVAAAPTTITVGSRTLTLCNKAEIGYCGSIDRPLDPAGKVSGRVKVGFEFYPRGDQSRPRLGTVLPQEGGPGYSSTGTRDFYLGLFGSLRDRRDVLIIDKRGSGLSDPIDCPVLQSGAVELSAVTDCAAQLGASAWFYGTRFAAADIIAVLDALAIQEVDFYGDSYGTFVGQVLAALYPQRLRSIILDSAYPVRAPDPWFATDWSTAWNGIDLSCSRSPSCRALGGAASARVKQLLGQVRRRAITGSAPDAFGIWQRVTLDTGALLRLIDYAGGGGSIYRELDAAARAWLDARDARPLLRLSAEQESFFQDDPEDFSYGLYAAVTCSDYPLFYDLKASGAKRKWQYQQALNDARATRAHLFAPFTVDEALDSQVYITPLDSCLTWPAPPADQIAGQPIPSSVKFPAVPTLVLSGDLDAITSPQDAAQTAAQFPNAVHVIVPNLTHVVAYGDLIGCTLGIVERFVTTLAPGDTSCTRAVRPVRTVPRFVKRSHDLTPLPAMAGDATNDEQRRIAAAGLEAIGDALARYWSSYDLAGKGLRGGRYRYSYSDTGLDFRLSGFRWTEDVSVTGTIAWNTDTSLITATINLSRDGIAVGSMNARWNDAGVNAIATVTGMIQGATLKASRIAP